MAEFFQGWRRKVGCVTLVMALMFTGAWIRSFVVDDEIAFPSDITMGRWSLVGVATENRSLVLYGDRLESEPEQESDVIEMLLNRTDSAIPEIHLTNREIEPADVLSVSNGADPDADEWIQVGGPMSVPSRITTLCSLSFPTRLMTIPFASIVIPLTLVSAYLIFSKPKSEASRHHRAESPHA